MELQTTYDNKSSYKTNLELLMIFVLTSLIVFIIIKSIFMELQIAYEIIPLSENIFFDSFTALFELWKEIQYISEHLVLYTFVMILFNLLKCFNESISSAVDKRKYVDSEIHEDFDQWSEIYLDLYNCTNLLSKCFQDQMSFSILLSPVYYISTIHGVFTIVMTKDTNNYMLAVKLLFLVAYCMYTSFIVFYAGQKLKNEADILDRRLADFNCSSSVFSDTRKTKTFLNFKRLTSTQSIKVEFMKTQLGMYLIPAVIWFTVTHVVIALQLNNLI